VTFRRRALGLLAAVFVLPVALGVWSVTGASALSAHRLGFVALVMVMLAAGVLAWNLFRYEERLGEERNVLQAIIEGTSDGIFVKDRDGRFLLVNSAFAGLHDLTVADVVGRHENEVFPAHASFFLEEDARVMASGIAYASEFTDQSRGRRITTITSKTPFRDRDGHVRGVIGITRDISARKRAEDDLRETLEGLVQERTGELQSANAILQAVIEGTTDLVFVKDAEGRYLLLNTAVARNSGRTAEEILGRDDRVLFPTDLAGRFRDHDLEVMRTGEVKTFEEHVPSSGGTTRTLLTTKAPYRDAVGKTIGIIGIGRDITEHKQTEEAVRRTQKLESLGLLAGGVAHDFNNLLVAILGQTSLGLSRLPSDSPARANLEKAVRAAERAADLTRQMLAYSGRGHFQVTTVDLNALILDNLHLFEVAVPKNVRLRSELEPSLPWIDADVGQIQQVVMNLITNAAEAIGERPGTVTVTTGNRVVGGRDEALWRHTGEPLAPGTYVTLEVEDDGQGMSPAVRERMFDPFFTTKFTGRGLGLAAVLGIVRGHKGGLQVESEAGRGTHFRLVFPRSERSPVSREPALAAALAATGTVLVIDDEEVVREAVADALESEGIRYRLASDGDSGVALFREHGHDIGLVLLDLSMPGRSGEETFQELRRLDAGIPVLLSSGFAEEEARGRFAPEDLAGFLQKPYRFPTLVAEVKRCLRPRA
jgi:two-component system, cell cycle sensor histidine kinase and response regulator CckA